MGIQKPKELGGLGVGDLIIENVALLFKWWWHFNERDDSLWKKIVHPNYYSRPESRVRHSIASDAGSIWNQLTDLANIGEFIQDTVQIGIRRKVGDDRSTKFWCDKWVEAGVL